MARSPSLVAKRVILGLLGLAGLLPVAFLVADVVHHPDREGPTMMFIFLLGAPLGPFLLTRWVRWRRLRSGNRVGAMFLTAYLGPPLLLVLARYEHAEDAAFVAGPLAIAITSLWWSSSGYRLDENRPAGSGTSG